jgi:hypothetical protein
MAFNKNVSARLPELEELNRPHNQTSILSNIIGPVSRRFNYTY